MADDNRTRYNRDRPARLVRIVYTQKTRNTFQIAQTQLRNADFQRKNKIKRDIQNRGVAGISDNAAVLYNRFRICTPIRNKNLHSIFAL